MAIAFESVVKLLAFLAVGGLVTWGVFGGFHDLAARSNTDPRAAQAVPQRRRRPDLGHHDRLGAARDPVPAAPVPHDRGRERRRADVRKAAWLFPLYLVAINIFVIPIAIAGLTLFPGGTVDADMFVVAVPIAAGHRSSSTLLAFIGGLSAATGMVIVASVAVSNMVSNDLMMPIVLHGRRLGLAEREDIGELILQIRRSRSSRFMLLAYSTTSWSATPSRWPRSGC